jgi:hypothetical protein
MHNRNKWIIHVIVIEKKQNLERQLLDAIVGDDVDIAYYIATAARMENVARCVNKSSWFVELLFVVSVHSNAAGYFERAFDFSTGPKEDRVISLSIHMFTIQK